MSTNAGEDIAMSKGTFSQDAKVGAQIEELIFNEVICRKLKFTSEKTARLEIFDSNPDEQFEGGDILIRQGPSSNWLRIDVKSAVDWAGKSHGSSQRPGWPMNSFILELDYLNEGKERPGWFVDSHKTTDIYAFCWFPKVTKSCSRSSGRAGELGYHTVRSLDDIERCIVVFADRSLLQQAVFNELKRAKANDGQLIDVPQMMEWFRSFSESYRTHHRARLPKLSAETRCKIMCSAYLDEQPINLKVPRYLIQQADSRGWSFVITRDTCSGSWQTSKLPSTERDD